MILPLPFKRELNELFQTNRHMVLKVLGGIFVGAFVAVGAIEKLPTAIALGLIGAASAIGGIGVCALSLKDVVRARIARGEPTNVILRSYLICGRGSLFLWIATAILGTLLVTFLTLP